MRRATPQDWQGAGRSKNFYPRSPCGERLWGKLERFEAIFISIHALLAESDGIVWHNHKRGTISIHALLAESDIFGFLIVLNLPLFLSTLSLRRATSIFLLPLVLILQFLSTLSLRRATTHDFTTLYNIFISIHALLAESDYLVRGQRPNWRISIHALLAESDCITTTIICTVLKFLSTLSLRRATKSTRQIKQTCRISIHALLAESDGLSYFYIIKITDFYPRSPCGERPNRRPIFF